MKLSLQDKILLPQCFDCDLPYSSPAFQDLIIPFEKWKLISSSGTGDGLLCPNCMCARAYKLGLENIQAVFTSGPFAIN